MRLLVIMVLGLAALAVLSSGAHSQKSPAMCGKGHRAIVIELDLFPDPIAFGQTPQAWRLTLDVDGQGECSTVLEIRETPENTPVAQPTSKVLRPGRNEVELKPFGKLRFSEREHCYQVLADIGGAKQVLFVAQRFCAREISRNGRFWTMK